MQSVSVLRVNAIKNNEAQVSVLPSKENETIPGLVLVQIVLVFSPVPSLVSKSLPKTLRLSLLPTATCAMKGMRLLGTPTGSSPIRPDSWAPTGLK